MNAGRDVERVIADWFVEEAVPRAPDRILDAAGRVVDRTKQRRFGTAWRVISMSAPLRLAAAAVIGVLAIGGSLFLIGRASNSNIGGPVSSASPPASPSASPSPSAPASIAGASPATLPNGVLTPGTYVVTPFASGRPGAGCMTPPQTGCTESEDDSFSATVTVPNGWAGADSLAIWLPAEHNAAPAGAALAFNRGGWLNSNPCLTAAQLAANVQPDVAVGPSVDDFANALADHPLLEATDPVEVMLGGYSGKYVDLQLPTDLTGCTTSYYPWAPTLYAQGPGHRWHLWILDVDGMRFVVMAMDYAGTSAQHQAELTAMVESIQIER
jgi:hypothetical protein